MTRGTTAALNKLRTCDGYLAVYAEEAALCLSPAYTATGQTDVTRCRDLNCFLDAAHGGSASHQTMLQRHAALSSKPTHPQELATLAAAMHTMDPTNVHILLLQRAVLCSTWWA